MINDDEVRREITIAKYKGFGVGLISAWAIALGGLEVALRVNDVQISPTWENVTLPATQRVYDSNREEIKKLSEPRIYNVTENKPLSQYIIDIEREEAELR